MIKKIILSVVIILLLSFSVYAEDEFSFYRSIMNKKTVNLEEVFKAFYLMENQTLDNFDYYEVIKIYIDKGVIKEFKRPISIVSKGDLAMIACKKLKIKGGLMFRIFKHNQRYALKECSYNRLLSSGSVDEAISGKELISFMDRCSKFLVQKGGK